MNTYTISLIQKKPKLGRENSRKIIFFTSNQEPTTKTILPQTTNHTNLNLLKSKRSDPSTLQSAPVQNEH